MDEACVSGNIPTKRKQQLKSLTVLNVVIVAGFFLYAFNPANSSLYAPCPFHEFSGFYCPGCGSLRGLHALLHGNLLTAFGFNPLMVVTLPFLGYGFLSYVMRGIRGNLLPRVFVPAKFIWIFLVLILLFWIFRNIPLYPFSLLAPQTVATSL